MANAEAKVMDGVFVDRNFIFVGSRWGQREGGPRALVVGELVEDDGGVVQHEPREEKCPRRGVEELQLRRGNPWGRRRSLEPLLSRSPPPLHHQIRGGLTCSHIPPPPQHTRWGKLRREGPVNGEH